MAKAKQIDPCPLCDEQPSWLNIVSRIRTCEGCGFQCLERHWTKLSKKQVVENEQLKSKLKIADQLLRRAWSNLCDVHMDESDIAIDILKYTDPGENKDGQDS